MFGYDNLRKLFASLAARCTRPAQASVCDAPVDLDDIVRRLDSVCAFNTVPVGRGFSISGSGYMQREWECLFAERIGKPAGVRTLFVLRRVSGFTEERGHRIEHVMTGGVSAPVLDRPMALEALIPQMDAHLAVMRRGVPGCFLDQVHFNQPTLAEMRALVGAYRAQNPRKTGHLTLVPK
ncbi:hypothetical protein [Micavibrio aeruginosavorus]|uniref:hypothetical protein n=1 Tax=Micavibrio aeruginosavorus TaxID=349221 RepID=UPI003F4AD905